MDIHYIYMASHLHVDVNVPPSQHCHYHFHNICYILCTCTNLCNTEHSEIRNVCHIDYMNTSFLQCFFFCDWSVKVSFDVHCHTLYTRLFQWHMVHKSRFTCQSHDQITKKFKININIAYGGLLSLATTPHLIVRFQGSSSHHNFGREIRVSQNIRLVIVKPLLATARVAQCISAVHLFVCLTVKCKNAIFSKTKQFRAMVSIDDL